MIGVSLGGSFPQGVPAPGLLLDAARHADASGFDAIWSGDHVMMYSPIVECVTLLSAIAAVTTRVRLGTAVYLLPPGTLSSSRRRSPGSTTSRTGASCSASASAANTRRSSRPRASRSRSGCAR